jgi:hypothetical protein
VWCGVVKLWFAVLMSEFYLYARGFYVFKKYGVCSYFGLFALTGGGFQHNTIGGGVLQFALQQGSIHQHYLQVSADVFGVLPV